jgi:hypothetical protein
MRLSCFCAGMPLAVLLAKFVRAAATQEVLVVEANEQQQRGPFAR